MRLLVCGSRDYADRRTLERTLDRIAGLEKIEVVIEGEALGADTLGKRWARGLRIPVAGYPADWDTHGRKAGPERNKLMLQDGKPDLVVAFVTEGRKLSDSRGTANMVGLARAAGVRVLVVGIDDRRKP